MLQRKPKLFLVALVLGIVLAASMVGGNEKSWGGVPDANESVSAVYLWHTGESDKPIFPVVICVKKPTEQQLQKILPAYEVDHARIYPVQQDELDQIMTRVTEILLKEELADGNHAHGALAVVVTEKPGSATPLLPQNLSQVKRHLSLDCVPEALAAIESVTLSKSLSSDKLHTVVASLKVRLGVEVER